MRSTVDEFQLWMQKSGNKRKVGGERIPAEPLSPRTSSRHLKKTRRILRDLGYLLYIKNPIPRRPNQWLVNPDKDVRFLSVEEIESWFESHFPGGDRTPRDKARQNDYAGAIRKFGEFMHYGKGVWSEEKLEKIRRRILLYDVAYPELEIVEPAKAHAFQRWLEAQPGYYVHGAMLYLMQWLGMRYLEVVKAKASLDGPTLKVDWAKSWVTIWGKGKGGLSKQRSLPLRAEVAQKLKDYLQWRQDHGLGSEDLFATTWGRSWSESSWGFNKTIRTLCLPRFDKWVLSRNRPELTFSQEEIRKMTTHKMGRHVFGTVYAPQLPAKTLMEYMGITKFSVVQRYINFSKAEKVDQFEKATKKILGTQHRYAESSPAGGPEALLDQLRSMAPLGKEQAWIAFLNSLKAMFAGEEKQSDSEAEATAS
jgi:integrase